MIWCGADAFRVLPLGIAGGLLLWTGNAITNAAGLASLQVTVQGLRPGGLIPTDLAFCIPSKEGHLTLGPNKSPAIRWSKGPGNTATYAIIMYDSDVPSVGEDVNKEGKVVPASLKRVNFYHWVLVDIPATVRSVPKGADSNGVTAHGKPPGPTPQGVRGVNDYTSWFASDSTMAGDYGGYDGPCPPWNDAIVHHYHFTVYALGAHLTLPARFSGPDALNALQGHILAKGEVTGLYALNPAIMKKIGMK